MYTEEHTIKTLFEQLGLPASKSEIQTFLNDHSLEDKELIENASFWNAGQAEFIRDSKQEDSDWAVVVDELDAMLRAT